MSLLTTVLLVAALALAISQCTGGGPRNRRHPAYAPPGHDCGAAVSQAEESTMPPVVEAPYWAEGEEDDATASTAGARTGPESLPRTQLAAAAAGGVAQPDRLSTASDSPLTRQVNDGDDEPWL